MTTEARWLRRTAIALAVVVLLAVVPCWVSADDQQKPANKKEKTYALIFGTAYGPDDRPLYGVKITIHPQGKKRPSWDLVSDHRGEFAQRVPPGPAEYLVTGRADYAPAGDDGKPQLSRKKRLRGETKVHVEHDERLDIGVHLTE